MAFVYVIEVKETWRFKDLSGFMIVDPLFLVL